MDKTYFFMAGLPRSGSTLLSSILNQNPDMYVGSQTEFPTMMLSIYHLTQNSESFNSGYNTEGYVNLLSQMLNNFYIDTDKKFVIDRNRTWGTTDHIKLLDLLSSDVKIICPVRPILEILASFVTLAQKNPNNFIDKRIDEIPAGYYRPINDARCDWLMSANQSIEHGIFSLATALEPEHRHKFHFVIYEDLVTNPTKTIKQLYEFLGIPEYPHRFDNFEWIGTPNEEAVFGIRDMHLVNPKLKTSKTDVSILSEYTQKKYKHTLDFLSPIVEL